MRCLLLQWHSAIFLKKELVWQVSISPSSGFSYLRLWSCMQWLPVALAFYMEMNNVYIYFCHHHYIKPTLTLTFSDGKDAGPTHTQLYLFYQVVILLLNWTTLSCFMLNLEGLLKEKTDFLTITSQDLIEIVFYFLLWLFLTLCSGYMFYLLSK